SARTAWRRPNVQCPTEESLRQRQGERSVERHLRGDKSGRVLGRGRSSLLRLHEAAVRRQHPRKTEEIRSGLVRLGRRGLPAIEVPLCSLHKAQDDRNPRESPRFRSARKSQAGRQRAAVKPTWARQGKTKGILILVSFHALPAQALLRVHARF